MNYRKLEPSDYARAQHDLSTLTSYYTLVAAALELFGPSAHKVEVELDGEYNDEGGTDYRVTTITASDKDGKSLDFDLTTDFWKTAFKRDAEYAAKYNDYKAFDVENYDPDDLQYSLEEHFSDELADLRYSIHAEGYDAFDFECIVGQVPDVEFKELYVLEN